MSRDLKAIFATAREITDPYALEAKLAELPKESLSAAAWETVWKMRFAVLEALLPESELAYMFPVEDIDPFVTCAVAFKQSLHLEDSLRIKNIDALAGRLAEKFIAQALCAAAHQDVNLYTISIAAAQECDLLSKSEASANTFVKVPSRAACSPSALVPA